MYFTRDTAPFLHMLKDTGADGFAIDWRTDMARARKVLGDDVVLQGNLDPIALYAPPAEIRRRVRRIIESAGPRRHIFNLGHGITPQTPLSGVEAAIASLLPLLDKGDVIVDMGNEWYELTEARQARVSATGIHYMGCGLSGGGDGARNGPCLLPGGHREAWELMRPLLEVALSLI